MDSRSPCAYKQVSPAIIFKYYSQFFINLSTKETYGTTGSQIIVLKGKVKLKYPGEFSNLRYIQHANLNYKLKIFIRKNSLVQFPPDVAEERLE